MSIHSGNPIYPLKLALIALALCAACAVSPTEKESPWRLERELPDTAASKNVALWAGGGKAIIAWPGAPAMPNIRVIDMRQPGNPVPLALGIRPGRVALYPLAGGWFQLLWIDQKLPGQGQLVGGTLGSGRDVRRGPTVITQRQTIEFAAVPSPHGDLHVFWVEGGETATPIYGALIDSIGRPHEPNPIAASGRYPAAAYDANGDLHLAWLEQAGPGQWTVKYVFFPGGQVTAARAASENIPIAIIPLHETELMDGLVLACDAQSVYILWAKVNLDANPHGTIGGLAFPIGDSSQTHTLDVSLDDKVPAGTSLRWPSAIALGKAGATLAVTASSAAQTESWRSSPLLITLNPTGVQTVEIVPGTDSGERSIGRVSLARDERDVLHIAWSALQPDGTATITYVTRQPGARPVEITALP